MQLHMGAYGHMQESALKVDSGRKPPCHTRELNLRQRHDGPTDELHPHPQFGAVLLLGDVVSDMES